MVGKILIDTNVLLDYLLEREPFFEDAKKVISSCTEGKTKGCGIYSSSYKGKNGKRAIIKTSFSWIKKGT